ncbi:hypothetical protein [Roseateles sp. P5_D6]
MKPLNVELKPAFPWRSVGMWVVVGAAALGTVMLAWANWLVRCEIEELSKSNARLEVGLVELKARRQAALVKPPYLDALGTLVSISQFPLNSALEVLERVDVPGTRVVSLEIDTAEHRALAIVEASSAANLQLFLEGLAAQGADSRWQLQSVSSGSAQSGTALDLQTSSQHASSPSASGQANLNVRQPWAVPAESKTAPGATNVQAVVVWK